MEAVVSHSVAQATPALHTHHAAGTAVCAAAQSTRTAEKFLSADSSVYPITMEKGVLIQNRGSTKTRTTSCGERSGHWKNWREFTAWETEFVLEDLDRKFSKERVSLHTQLPLRQKGVADMNWGLCKQQYNVKQIFFD